jgi:CheY-like chemotaxis protein
VTSSTLFETVVASFGGSIKTFGGERPAVPDLDVTRLRGARVLLVEDNEINREVALGHLADAELIVDVAENGAVAVQMVQQNDYDGVLMDVQMPVMDGRQATQEIRAWENASGATPTPVIALTAHAVKEEIDRCLAAGCNAHLSKPIKKATLLEAIRGYTAETAAAG